MLVCAVAATAHAEARGLARLADGIAAELRAAATDAGRAPAATDVALAVRGRPPRLAADLGALARTRVEAAGFRSVELVPAIDAQAARRGVDLAVELEVTCGRDGAAVDGMATALGPAPWRDQPAALAHLHLAAPLDGELRAYLPPEDHHAPPAGPLRGHGAPVGDLALLALDAGDLDGDGRAEVVGATADEVIAWRFDGGRFVELRRMRFPGPLAPVRPRDDVATVAVDGGEIRARSSRFADGLRMRLDGRPQPLAGFPLPGLSSLCTLEPGVDWFRDTGCAPPLALPPRFWAAAGMRNGRPAWAAVDPDRTLWIWPPATGTAPAPPVSVRGAGAQVALANLPRGEVVATGDAVEPGVPDALVVRTLAGALVGKLDRLPGAVTAITAADLDGDGAVELVAAVRAPGRTELWLAW